MSNANVVGPAPVVIRNDASMTLVDQVFGKRSPEVGRHFWAPVATKENFQSFVTWFGIEDLLAGLNVIGRRIFADIILDHLKENDGVIDEAALMEEYANFTAGRESLADIEDQLDDLQDKAREIFNDPALQFNDAGQPVGEKALALTQSIRAINAQISPLKEKKVEIEAEYARRAALRKVTKEKKAAAKKLEDAQANA